MIDKKIKILFAEDNKINQKVADVILKKHGYTVDFVENGEEAITALKSKHFDMVLMDLEMPIMGGLEATKIIRESTSELINTGIPIIALTAHTAQGDLAKCIQAGMNDYLSKPINPELLIEKIEFWLMQKNDQNIDRYQTSVLPESSTMDFNQADFLDRVMDDIAIAKIVIESFLSDIPVQIKILQKGLLANDSQLSEKQAHRIKGACANLGAEKLTETLSKIENLCREADLVSAKIHFSKIDEEFQLLAEKMEMFLKSLN